MPKYPFNVGDVVTPATTRSSYYGRHGVVQKVGVSEEECWVKYDANDSAFMHSTWPLKLVEDFVVDKILTKYSDV